MIHVFNQYHAVLGPALLLVAAAFLATIGHRIGFSIVRRMAAAEGRGKLDLSVRRYLGQPVRILVLFVAAALVVPLLSLPTDLSQSLQHLLVLGLIAAVAWVLIGLAGVGVDLSAMHFDTSVRDNLTARRIQTQVQVLYRIAVVMIVIIATSTMAMTFPSIRELGISLFASAGLAGLAIGIAARPTLANLIAGLQIALAEPIRLDDVVIVEGEWGWIEEITTTYVVVRIWDLRRLVVPLSYFIENPFQNWTRRTADILGTVFIYTDYTVPVDRVRQALHDILQNSGMWDGAAWGLQVTNASEHTLELRALMSATDSGTAWDLRCHVREKLIDFLQNHYPECLPRIRADLDRSRPSEPTGPKVTQPRSSTT